MLADNISESLRKEKTKKDFDKKKKQIEGNLARSEKILGDFGSAANDFAKAVNNAWGPLDAVMQKKNAMNAQIAAIHKSIETHNENVRRLGIGEGIDPKEIASLQSLEKAAEELSQLVDDTGTELDQLKSQGETFQNAGLWKATLAQSKKELKDAVFAPKGKK